MEFWLGIIAIVALIIAINNQSAIKELKRENKTLRQLITNLLQQTPQQPQDVVPEIQQQAQHVVQQRAKHIGPPQQQQKPVVHKEPKPQKNMENIFGKNVIGVVASILMFIGIFAFGTLVFTSLTDAIKVVGMFLLSGGALAAGLLLTKKNQTVFSTIVTGCGIGMLYISIFLTHLYFHMIGDIATFVLIFLWAAAVLFLSKKFKMPSLSYLALAGCVISSILAQVYGVSQQMFVEITIYHMLTFVLLIIANKENLVLFKISAYSSIGLNTILSIIIAVNASDMNRYGWLYLCFILGLYNIAIGILTYREERGIFAVDTTLSLAAYLFNMIFTALIPFSVLLGDVWMKMDDVHTLLPADMNVFYARQSWLFHVGVLLIVAASYAAYHFLMKTPQKRNCLLITTEVIWGFLMLLEPIQFINGNSFGFLLILPIANLLLYKFSQDECTKQMMYWSGFAMLLFDAVSSLFFVFEYPVFGMLYSIALIGVSGWYMYEKYGYIMKFPFLQCALINCHLLFTMANCFGNDECWNATLIIIVLLNMLLAGLAQLGNRQNKTSEILVECMHSLLAFILFWVVRETSYEFAVSSFILSILLIPFVLIRLKDVIMRKETFMSVWYGIKFTFYTFGTLDLFTNFTEQQFIVSVVLMLLASACIAFGFWKDMKPLRIYGLVLVMSSVAKMVILDVWNQESMVRVLSLIGGALICFAISAVYTKIEAKQLKE